MFDNQYVTPQQVIEIAKSTGQSELAVAVKMLGYRASASFWGNVEPIDDAADKFPVISIGNDRDVVGKYSAELARAVQFPKSSAYAHFLGCVSAAMVNRFWVEYGKNNEIQPTALFVVTSQPPSAGKSAINNAATNPIAAEVALINQDRAKRRKRLKAEIASCQKELKLEKSKSELADLYEEKERKEEELEKMADVVPFVSDTTPEGLARVNNRQGYFTVLSDEATAINSMLGLTYGNGDGKKVNSELVLKSWDKGHVSIARSNVENNMNFMALGAIAVIAQDETIMSIMEAGSRGNGVSERFLLMREKPMLGDRVFVDDSGDLVWNPIDASLKAEYAALIHNIMHETDIKLNVSESASKVIAAARQQVEPYFKEGEKYSHSMLRGSMGKMDKQVLRIASVIHVIREWCTGGRKSKTIDVSTVQEALLIYGEFSKTYIGAANSSGFAGEQAEMRKLAEIVIRLARRGRGSTTVHALYDEARKVRPFYGQSGTYKRIDEALLPMMEKLRYVCKQGTTVYVNPNLL